MTFFPLGVDLRGQKEPLGDLAKPLVGGLANILPGVRDLGTNAVARGLPRPLKEAEAIGFGAISGVCNLILKAADLGGVLGIDLGVDVALDAVDVTVAAGEVAVLGFGLLSAREPTFSTNASTLFSSWKNLKLKLSTTEREFLIRQ